MGTSKRELKVSKVTEITPLTNSSVDDFELLPEQFPTQESWINTTNALFNIPSAATKTIKGEVFNELEQVFLDILMSDNDYAIRKAKVLVDTARMKLKNLKRDNNIG